MKNFLCRFFLIIGIASVIVGIDAFSKCEVMKFFSNSETTVYPLTSFLNLVLVKNHGISFGTFNNSETSQLYLIVLTSLIIAVFFAWGLRTQDSRLLFPIALVMGGAFGNVIDRIAYGAVIDFIDFHYGTLHYPAFNFADSCIFLGVVAIIFIPTKKEE